jgi:hypothetical protein
MAKYRTYGMPLKFHLTPPHQHSFKCGKLKILAVWVHFTSILWTDARLYEYYRLNQTNYNRSNNPISQSYITGANKDILQHFTYLYTFSCHACARIMNHGQIAYGIFKLMLISCITESSSQTNFDFMSFVPYLAICKITQKQYSQIRLTFSNQKQKLRVNQSDSNLW